MLGMISVDKEAVRSFAELMTTHANSFAQVRESLVPRYAGSDFPTDPDGRYRGGVRVNLGSVEYQHPGSVAGVILADRIAEALNFVISMEEGARALGTIAQEALDAMGNTDQISADDLHRILSDAAEWEYNDPYGMAQQLKGLITGVENHE